MGQLTLPNKISIMRILLAPGLVVAGGLGQGLVFLALFPLLLLSDFVDGVLARQLDCQTRLGAQLDTAGDALMTFCAIGGGWLLWPERVLNEAPFFLVVVGMLGVSGGVCLIKYRHFPSYHAWSAKVSTALAGVGVWVLFTGATPWFFRISIGILAYSAIEETLITLILPSWRPNIPTVFHALRARRNEAAGTTCVSGQ